jgi:hypothetical protein
MSSPIGVKRGKTTPAMFSLFNLTLKVAFLALSITALL